MRKSEQGDALQERKPCVQAEMVVETDVVLRIGAEVVTAIQVDEVTEHPEASRQHEQQYELSTAIRESKMAFSPLLGCYAIRLFGSLAALIDKI